MALIILWKYESWTYYQEPLPWYYVLSINENASSHYAISLSNDAFSLMLSISCYWWWDKMYHTISIVKWISIHVLSWFTIWITKPQNQIFLEFFFNYCLYIYMHPCLFSEKVLFACEYIRLNILNVVNLHYFNICSPKTFTIISLSGLALHAGFWLCASFMFCTPAAKCVLIDLLNRQ